jgi:hypothetical protein
MLFNFGGPPEEQQIDRVVGMAVHALLAAYRI